MASSHKPSRIIVRQKIEIKLELARLPDRQELEPEHHARD